MTTSRLSSPSNDRTVVKSKSVWQRTSIGRKRDLRCPGWRRGKFYLLQMLRRRNREFKALGTASKLIARRQIKHLKFSPR